MRYASVSFRSPAELTAAAGVVARRYPSIEVEVGETCLHLYADEDRPLWGEILVSLRADGIRPIRPRPTWAGRLAALARRRGLEAYAIGDYEVLLVSEDIDTISALAAAAARRGLAFAVRAGGGAWEGDPLTRLRLVPGEFSVRGLDSAIHAEHLRVAEEVTRWRE